MYRVIKASRDNRNYYVVHYGWDEGGPESGPIFKSDNIIVKARSAQDAENRIYNKMGPGIEGCWAEPATDEDVANFIADMKESNEEYQYLVDSGLIDSELDAQMSEWASGPDYRNMSMSELKKYYSDFIENDYDDYGNHFDSFRDWLEFLRSNGNR